MLVQKASIVGLMTNGSDCPWSLGQGWSEVAKLCSDSHAVKLEFRAPGP